MWTIIYMPVFFIDPGGNDKHTLMNGENEKCLIS